MILNRNGTRLTIRVEAREASARNTSTVLVRVLFDRVRGARHALRYNVQLYLTFGCGPARILTQVHSDLYPCDALKRQFDTSAGACFV